MIPGGLVLRTAGLLDDSWQLERFAACDCVLCTYSTYVEHRLVWVVVIADRNDTWRLTVSPYELGLVLQAWLSPLPPPAVDRLTDLQ